jgi:N-acetyl sugar amidotransferase
MLNINYCKKCLYPETKQDLWFDSNGVCSACLAFDNRSEINWQSRKEELNKIVTKYKKDSGYDCIVPVSGGKDSTYQILQVLNLGLKPLAVIAETCDLSEIGQRNIDNLKSIGVDVIQYSTSKNTRGKLNRAGLELVGDISWPEHLSIYTTPVRIAVNFNIPLIIWGENPQNEFGGPAGSEDNNTVNRSWLEEFGGLIGLRIDDLVGFEGLELKDMTMFLYPDDSELKRVGVTGLFLGYYLPWEGYNNKLIAQANGFESYGKPVEGHFCDYENLDNCQAGLHEYLMYLKFGYGRATAQVCMDIRRGRVSREDAANAVIKLEGMYPISFLGKKLENILDDINMTKDQFDLICDQYTNYELFELNKDGELLKNPDGSPVRKYFP